MATSSSASTSGGLSTSTSVPGLLPSPATDFSLQLSELLQQLGMSQNAWAQQQFAQASAVTDAQINNYIAQAQQGSDLAGGMLSDYNKVFAPMTDQYAGNAASYASQGRVQNEMGRAESNQMQAGNAAKNNAESELQSFGIDPSSGRYQDLVRASDTANAAAAAGAGETARVNTENQGQQRQLNAIQMGQQLPGAAVNALNSAYQGIAGAENSALGLANTGVNLTTSPNQFLSTAQQVKVPPVGNTSTSASRNGTTSAQQGGGGGGSGNKGGGGGGGNGPTTNASGYPNTFNQDQAYVNANQVAHPAKYDFQQGQLPTDSSGTPGATQAPGDTPWGPVDFGAGGTDSQSGDWGAGNGQSPVNGLDAYGYDFSGGGGGASPYDSNFDYGNSYTGGGDGSGGFDASSSDYSGGDYGDYAKGGVIPGQPQGGGHVPPSMSPSGGRQTDDVSAVIPQTGGRAQINVGEFVLPRDVVQWKGQEFFQKMIAQARKARTGAPAKPSQGQ